MERARAGHNRAHIVDQDLSGFKYFERLKPLLARLHDVGCDLDKAHNRDPHFDDYCTLVLGKVANSTVRLSRRFHSNTNRRCSRP